MGTTSNKLQKVLDSKEAIRTAIVGKGVGCEITVPFSQYSSKIASIEQGGSSNSLEEGKDFLLVDSPFPSAATLTTIACDNGDILLSSTTSNAGVYKLDRTTKTWTKILNNDYNITRMFTDSLGNMYFISNYSGYYAYKYSIDGTVVKLNTDSGTGQLADTNNKWIESKYGDIIIIPYSNSNDVYILNKTTNILEKKDSKGTGYEKYYYEAKNGDLYIFGSKLLRYNYSSSTWESYITTLPSTVSGVFEKSTGEIFMTSGYSSYPYILMFSPVDKIIYTIYTGNSSNYNFKKIIEIGGVVFFSAEYTSYGTGVLIYDEANKITKVAYATLCNYTAGFVANSNIYLCSSNNNILKYNRDTFELTSFCAFSANVAISVDGGFILGNSTNNNQGLYFFNIATETIVRISEITQNYGLYPGSYFYDKNNILCFYTRSSGIVKYWDSVNKILKPINGINFPTNFNNGFVLIYRDKNGNCILSANSNSTCGIIIHKSITDAYFLSGIGWGHSIISASPLLFSTSYIQSPIFKWDENLSEGSTFGLLAIASSVILGKYRMIYNDLFDVISGKSYMDIVTYASSSVLNSSKNNTYGIASINTNSVIKLLIV